MVNSTSARLIRAPIDGHRLIRVQSMQGGQSIVRGRLHKQSLSIIREMKDAQAIPVDYKRNAIVSEWAANAVHGQSRATISCPHTLELFASERL